MGAAARQALDGDDVGALQRADGDAAAEHRAVVDDDRAGAAVAAVAAIFGAGQIGGVPQRPEQGRRGVEMEADRFAVDRHAGHRRDASGRLGPCKASPARHHGAGMGAVGTSSARSASRSEAAAMPCRSSSCTASAPTRACGGRSSTHFGRARRAIAFDYPGYGDSDSGAGRQPRRLCATRCWRRWTRWASSRAHVCGLSLGGVVAIAMHAAAPERCASLILADTFAVAPRRRGDLRSARSRPAGRSACARWPKRGSMCCSGSAADARAARRGDRDDGRDRSRRLSRSAPKRCGSPTSATRRGDIDVPTLVLCGTEDRITPPALSEELAALIPGARLRADRRRRPPRQCRAAGRVQRRDRSVPVRSGAKFPLVKSALTIGLKHILALLCEKLGDVQDRPRPARRRAGADRRAGRRADRARPPPYFSPSKTQAILGGESRLAAILAQQSGQPLRRSRQLIRRAMARRWSRRGCRIYRPAIAMDRPDVFNSVALPIGHTSLDRRWRKVANGAGRRDFGRLRFGPRRRSAIEQLEAVNRYVNARVSSSTTAANMASPTCGPRPAKRCAAAAAIARIMRSPSCRCCAAPALPTATSIW